MSESHFRTRARQLREEYPDRTSEKLSRESKENQAKQTAIQHEQNLRASREAYQRQQVALSQQERKAARAILLQKCVDIGEDLATTLSEMGISPELKANVPVKIAYNSLGARILNAFRPNYVLLHPVVAYEEIGLWRLTESRDFWSEPQEAWHQSAPHAHWDGGGPYVAPQPKTESKYYPSGGAPHGLGLLQSGVLVNYKGSNVTYIDSPPANRLEVFEGWCVGLLEKEIIRTSHG